MESVDRLYSECIADNQSTVSRLYRSDYVLTTYNKSPSLVVNSPEAGAIVSWQMWQDDRPTTSGHTGIIVEVLDSSTVRTIEGNIRDESGEVIRYGERVCLRTRKLTNFGKMRVKGFLKPW